MTMLSTTAKFLIAEINSYDLGNHTSLVYKHRDIVRIHNLALELLDEISDERLCVRGMVEDEERTC